MKEKKIVKVQLSFLSSDGVPEVMLYDKERTFTDIFEADKQIIDLMDGKYKKFFLYTDKDGFIVLGEEIEEQDW